MGVFDKSSSVVKVKDAEIDPSRKTSVFTPKASAAAIQEICVAAGNSWLSRPYIDNLRLLSLQERDPIKAYTADKFPSG